MSEPFVFHFRRGENGHPEVMYMTDLRCRCGLCGHVQYQRFYHATPFHPFTLDAFDELAEEAHEKAGYECENCGTDVGGEQVEAACLTYGFADDAGLVRIFIDHLEDHWRYQLVPRRRLDPQAMPHWAPDPDEGPVFEEEQMEEATIESVLDRPFNPKSIWREVFQDWQADPEGGAYARVAPGFWIVIDESEELASELADDIEDEDFAEAYDDGDLMVIALSDAVPKSLPTHRNPQAMPGRYHNWLPRDIIAAVDSGKVWAEAYLSRKKVVDTLRRAFDTARLTYQVDTTGSDVFFSQITTPGEGVYGRGLSVSSVLRRAVYTGLTPGDAARLTAEEIIGVLLKVWK